MSTQNKIAIIGAGPAGMALSFFLRETPFELHLFEKNAQLGKKLSITGGGRMNVTNAKFTADHFLSSNQRYLRHVFASRFVEDRYALLAELGIEYVFEGDRAILKSGSAIKETERLSHMLRSQKNLTVHTGYFLETLKKQEEQFLLTFQQKEMLFDRVVLCSGGVFQLGGETRVSQKSFHLAESVGQKIEPISPMLSPLFLQDNPLHLLAGTALLGSLSIMQGSKKVQTITGDILCTHLGISGPAVLDFSAYIHPESHEESYALSFLPLAKESEMRATLREKRLGSHRLRSLLKMFLPERVADFHIEYLGLTRDIRVADISALKEKDLLNNIFFFPLRGVSLADYPACWTTKGGVSLEGVVPHTLESKLHKGLFFAGEILDISGLCGGYNISFSYISAKIVAEALTHS